MIKDHQLRFSFPGDCKVLESTLSPEPERELKVARNPDREISPAEVVYGIGHLEAGREVALQIVVTGESIDGWKRVSYNEAGNVEFHEKSAGRDANDSRSIVPFLVLTFLFATLPSIFSELTTFGSYLAALIRISILALLIPQLAPVARIIKERLAEHSERRGANFDVRGNRNSVIFNSGPGEVTARLSDSGGQA
ncbi:hypothetical protein [Kitasatospora sp. NPDC047058]|uniref:hypothetical protein n=1 Tax=Kitasatospora sp. NPDC047058 TaxID=3155620 RepID=UPI003405BC06